MWPVVSVLMLRLGPSTRFSAATAPDPDTTLTLPCTALGNLMSPLSDCTIRLPVLTLRHGGYRHGLYQYTDCWYPSILGPYWAVLCLSGPYWTLLGLYWALLGLN